MKNSYRIALIAAVVVVAVVAFVVLQASSDDDSKQSATSTTTTTSQPTTTATQATDEPTRTQTTAPEPPAPPPPPTIEVRDGEPVGGVKEIEAKPDEQVRFQVKSDVDEEVHLHGYDIAKPVRPGKPAEFDFKADIEGSYEIELHGTAAPIGELTVRP